MIAIMKCFLSTDNWGQSELDIWSYGREIPWWIKERIVDMFDLMVFRTMLFYVFTTTRLFVIGGSLSLATGISSA